MLADQSKQVSPPATPERKPDVRLPRLKTGLGWIGLGLLVVTTLGWLLTFPTLQLLNYIFSGDRNLFQPSDPNPVAAFFHSFPQLLWLGFAVGAALLFGSGVSISLLKPTYTPPAPEPALLQKPWLDWVWRLIGVGLLALILVIGANYRLADSLNIGDTDLVRTDYDEGVHASAALLMAHGKQIYRDFFLTQPPVGPLLWSLPLRLGGEVWGGLSDFLRLRLFTTLLSLVTIALVYLSGRTLGGKWAGPVAGAIGALALAIDGGAVRTDQQIMLEPVVNVFTAAAIWLFVCYGSYEGPRRRSLDLLLPLASGGMAGLALSVKIPALAVVVGLGLTLLIWRRWGAFGFYAAGVGLGYLLLTNYFLLTNGTAFIKQAYLYQLLRPFNNLALGGSFETETTLTAWDYLARTPYLAFTLLIAVIGLVAIVTRWALRGEGRQWLPITLVAVFTALLYTGKAGFFPHYYDQLALPLALLGGGVVNFWQLRVGVAPKRVGLALAVGGAVVLTAGLWPLYQHANDEPSRPQWSLERAVDRSFANLGLANGSLLTWDARYSFLTSRPMPTDSYKKYLVDSAAYVEYLALGFDGQSLGSVARQALLDKPTGDMRQLRYTPQVQEDLFGLAQKADYILIEDRAKSQLSPQTRQRFNQNFINRQDSRETTILSSSRFIKYPSGVLFGDRMRLVGFDSQPQIKLSPTGHKLPLTLFWRGEQKMDQNYVIFFHLLNDQGQTVAQRDTAPRYGALNTSQWTPGDLIDDDQSLDLATNLPAGRYKLEIGVYLPADGKRLAVSEVPSEQPQSSGGDSLILLEVDILGS